MTLNNSIIIVGDIHGDFDKLFLPLIQAGIIKNYNVEPTNKPQDLQTLKINNITSYETDLKITWKANEKLSSNKVIYIGDFIHHNKNPTHILILSVLVDLITEFPNNIEFVLGNHEISECLNYLGIDNHELFQPSAYLDSKECMKYKNYNEVMNKFINFLKTQNNLLVKEFDDFVISHTKHFKIFPASLNNCLLSIKKYQRRSHALRPSSPRYNTPIFFSNANEYKDIKNKYTKVDINNFDDYTTDFTTYITDNYENYKENVDYGNEHYKEVFD